MFLNTSCPLWTDLILSLFEIHTQYSVNSSQVRDQNSGLHIDCSNCAFSALAAQIKSMVNQLGTKQDTSDLRERLWVLLVLFGCAVLTQCSYILNMSDLFTVSRCNTTQTSWPKRQTNTWKIWALSLFLSPCPNRCVTTCAGYQHIYECQQVIGQFCTGCF